MYTRPIIHFTTLHELLHALPTLQPQSLIYIGLQEHRESRRGSHFPITAVTITLDVRMITPQAIYCYRPLAKTVYFSLWTQDERPSPAEKRCAAWREAEAVAAEIQDTVTAQDYRCARGQVDIGSAAPVVGEAWSRALSVATP